MHTFNKIDDLIKYVDSHCRATANGSELFKSCNLEAKIELQWKHKQLLQMSAALKQAAFTLEDLQHDAKVAGFKLAFTVTPIKN